MIASPQGPPVPPRPGRRPVIVKPAPLPWGWLEWMVLAQTVIPALLFVPGLSSIRIVTRVAAFGLSLLAWMAVRSRRGTASFPARPWLLCSGAILLLGMLNPGTNSIPSGIAGIILNLAVMAPAFWAGGTVRSPRQIPRMITLLLFCNGLSALVGVLQVYQPDRFNPPKINMVGQFAQDAMSVKDDSGRSVIRPCGLTDSPGAAALAGQIAAVVGLACAVGPVSKLRRLFAAGFAMSGLASIYFSQVRTSLILVALGAVLMVVLLLLQRDFRRATLLGAGGALALVGAFTWAVAVMGGAIKARTDSITATDAGTFIKSNRGAFIYTTFEQELPDYPLGAGLGRWGMMFANFGDPNVPKERGPLWVEIQLTGWVYDGGILLLVAYLGAVVVATLDSLRIALRCPDKTICYWAGSVAALNMGVLALCFTTAPFMSTMGIQFWMLAGALHAADRLARVPSAPSPPLPRPGPPGMAPRRV